MSAHPPSLALSLSLKLYLALIPIYLLNFLLRKVGYMSVNSDLLYHSDVILVLLLKNFGFDMLGAEN